MIARDGERVEEDFWARGGFDLRYVVSFAGLRGEIREREGGGECATDGGEVRAEGLGHCGRSSVVSEWAGCQAVVFGGSVTASGLVVAMWVFKCIEAL